MLKAALKHKGPEAVYRTWLFLFDRCLDSDQQGRGWRKHCVQKRGESGDLKKNNSAFNLCELLRSKRLNHFQVRRCWDMILADWFVLCSKFLVAEEKKEETAAPPAEDAGDVDDLVSISGAIFCDNTFQVLNIELMDPKLMLKLFPVYLQNMPQCVSANVSYAIETSYKLSVPPLFLCSWTWCKTLWERLQRTCRKKWEECDLSSRPAQTS